MRRIPIVILCAFMASSSINAQDADLGRGVRAYTDADYRIAITVLEGVDETKLRADEKVVLHKFLALSLIARKERERAQEELIKLLTINPGYEVNDKELSPSVLDLFQKSKVAYGTRLCDQGVEAYNAGRFQDAMPILEQALRLNQHDTRASEFLKLATNRVKEEEEKKPKKECFPGRAWGEIDAKSATCKGVDYSSNFKFPVQANRITVLYSKHYFGVGKCWKIVLYDSAGKEILVFDGPNRSFAGKESPGNADRWQEVYLPEVRTVARVVMYGEGGHNLEKFMGQRVSGKDLSDEFILGFEVICPEKGTR